ncbi:hypothetical protein LGM43_27980 [Burkholderia seminalis]|uniref:Uncharacterized protein n=1 Tax=Burkholderia cenocepacia TaxID=95486 RepID=A0ABD4U6T2_9BURK|nr:MULTISPECIES: hypothetical protein [Burkholderia cepacia complex]MCA7954117.1 hypothetical protein [Burkholderia seminalis]MCA8082007.1 hypothetical protein [Burkholderia cepacia]MCA8354721.1 hypothetical protein [Burkholderia cepacia]MCW3694340.1 hypothetical protein [Burkholderia cenocepacia]MCW3702433.1 hypothetical protein [Burkholderia cenocepacia]
MANLHRRLLVSVNGTTATYECTRVIRTNALLDERKLHLVFDASLWLKAAFVLSEVLTAVIAYFVQKQLLLTYVA